MSKEVTQPVARRLPRHVGIIMDGNGRWAQLRQLDRLEGHRVGADSVRDIVRASRQIGIKALTLYAFSAQNWARPAAEVTGLMKLLRDYLISERTEIMENGIRLHAVGNIERLPGLVRDPLDALMAESAHHDSMHLVLALSYGGRESIACAVRELAREVATGHLQPEDIDEDRLSSFLPTHELPPLDLLIRTSGEQRISNFMLWELAYAELIFSSTLWPDFRRHSLYEALEVYAQRERRFGLTGAQVSETELDLEPEPPSAIRTHQAHNARRARASSASGTHDIPE